jgi:hypothetical protein
MSFFRNTVRRQPTAAQTGVSRLLLFSQFDFQQKTWNLPALEKPLDTGADIVIFAREFLPPPLSAAKNFSDPAMGGVTPNRAGLGPERNPVGPAFGETTTTNQKKQ